jgi:ABC-2 type transport system ATP-binding protein
MNTLELKSVRKAYGDFVAVNDLAFSIRPGTIFGLLGPNGAGKTSTIRMIIGITIPDSGEVRMFGEPFRRDHLKRVGYLPEERGLYPKMKVLDQLVFFGELHGLGTGEAKKRALHWAERMEIADAVQKKTQELSKGMQQKIQFIATLLHEPELIIMDEPASGLDPVNSKLLENVLVELRKQGRTILFSTHRMEQVEKMCDEICLVNKGEGVLKGDVREIKSRHGKRNIRIECEGGSKAFLSNPGLVQSFDDYGNYVEVRLTSSADPQELLKSALAQCRVNRFELVEPSIEEIFIETVKNGNEHAYATARTADR